MDAEASKLEQGKGNEGSYEKKRDKLIVTVEEKNKDARLRTPRQGSEGCCGKGCNGCMIFWHSDLYAPAREIMAKKKMGEMLEKKFEPEITPAAE